MNCEISRILFGALSFAGLLHKESWKKKADSWKAALQHSGPLQRSLASIQLCYSCVLVFHSPTYSRFPTWILSPHFMLASPQPF